MSSVQQMVLGAFWSLNAMVLLGVLIVLSLAADVTVASRLSGWLYILTLVAITAIGSSLATVALYIVLLTWNRRRS